MAVYLSKMAAKLVGPNLSHVFSPQKDFFHVNSVCIGCIGRHVTLSLG